MYTSLTRKCVVGGILENGMSFSFTFSIVFTSNDFSNIRLNNASTEMINSVNSSGSNRGATF